MQFGFSYKDEKLWLVTEFVAGGDLSELIKNKEVVFNDILATDIAMKICKGMTYLHSEGIEHRDLKVKFR